MTRMLCGLAYSENRDLACEQALIFVVIMKRCGTSGKAASYESASAASRREVWHEK